MEEQEEVYVYLRTSTKDQNPELQLKDCESFASNNNLVIKQVFQEQKSAYKKVERVEFDKMLSLARTNKISILLWRYDRSFRNTQEFVSFMRSSYEVYKIKVYSAGEEWVNALWDLPKKLTDLPPPFDVMLDDMMKTQWRLLITLIGQQAEEESKKKGERVKLAVRKDGGVTKSYKGNKWGRKSFTTSTINRVLKARKDNPSLSIRALADILYYYDSSNNKVKMSKSAVHKILSENLSD